MLSIRWRGPFRLRPLHFQSLWLSRVLRSRGRCCGACGAARGIGWPRSPFGASGSSRLHGYARAPRSVGRWRSGPVAPWFSAEGPRRVGGSQFRWRDGPASQGKVSAEGSASGGSAEQWLVARVCRLSCGQAPPMTEGTFACSLPGVTKFRKKARHHLWSLCRLENEWRLAPHQRRTYPKAPDAVALATR